MARLSLRVNGKKHTVEVPEDMPVLWVLRNELLLKGTKYGCGIARCGACTIHLDGRAARACTLPVAAVGEAEITTIEGLSEHGDHPLQQAWIAQHVPQCGYCQAGQIMAAAAMLKTRPRPSDTDIDRQMSGNICRCGTYPRIKQAIKAAVAKGGDL